MREPGGSEAAGRGWEGRAWVGGSPGSGGSNGSRKGGVGQDRAAGGTRVCRHLLLLRLSELKWINGDSYNIHDS